jgi:hypothetical protein
MQQAKKLNHKSIRQVRMHKHAQEIINPAQLNRSYHMCATSEGTVGLKAGHGISTVQFKSNNLFIEDIHIVQPRFANDFVSWKQLTTSHYTCGHLHFSPGGVMLRGVIALGKTKADAITYQVVGSYFPLVSHSGDTKLFAAPLAASNLRTFTTQITKQRYPVDPKTNQPTQDPSQLPEDAWQTGLTLALGYDTTTHQQIVQLGEGEDISTDAFYKAADKPNQAGLVIAADSDSGFLCAMYPDLYIDASITLTLLATDTFIGTVATLCSDDPKTPPTGVYFWKGTSPSPQFTAAATPALLTTADLLQDSSLSVEELAGLVPGTGTSQTDINTMANSLLVENMKWAISQRADEQGWLTTFYGENPPVLSSEQQALATQSLGWYQDTYAKAQLGWQIANYSGVNKPDTQLTDAQTLQLKYFLQTGLAQDKDFNIQQQGLYPQAYALSLTRIRDYIADGGEKWAQQLSDMYNNNLAIDVPYVKSTHDMSRVNQGATLLTVLQPSGELAKAYYQNFITNTLQNQVDVASYQDQDSLMQWLPKWLQELLNQASIDPSKIPDSGKLAIEQLKELLAESGNNMATVADEMATILANAPGSTIWAACKNADDAWATQYPKASAIGKMFFFVAFSYGLSMVISAFANWKNMKPEDQGKLVTATVALGLEAIQIAPEMLISVKDMSVDIFNKIKAWRNSPDAQKSINEMGESVDPNYLQAGIDETTKLFNAETKTIEGEGTLWEKFFASGFKVVLKAVGILVAAAVAAFSIYDLVQDIGSGQPIAKEILDGVMAATNIAVVVCLVVELAVTSVVANVLGVVFALVGAIISIIEMFVIKPANPLDDFMKNTVIPFVNGLPPQTQPPAATDSTSTTLQVAFA